MNVSHLHIKFGAIEKRPFRPHLPLSDWRTGPLKPLEGNPEIIPEPGAFKHAGIRCHLYQGEAVVRSLRAMGNEDVNYFITTAGHSSLEPETESRLCTIMNDLPPMSPFDRGGE